MYAIRSYYVPVAPVVDFSLDQDRTRHVAHPRQTAPLFDIRFLLHIDIPFALHHQFQD